MHLCDRLLFKRKERRCDGLAAPPSDATATLPAMNCEALNQQDKERCMQSLGLLGKQYRFGEKKKRAQQLPNIRFCSEKKVSDDDES